ncbi:hypothetical protein D187_005189 [Cystobacter fuscus DSM 2262]|uniref:Uncharacterized protein n=1 Tax=Cystobacter fuscus (strain ATCC 25194 / DSM 2262 / NBRC 100088 / M29) TaxID=1242864 RepID=S9PM31_CYSF2|nr:hypothetical protein D187_005189 [Cystobacter fuscus DSM 2262]
MEIFLHGPRFHRLSHRNTLAAGLGAGPRGRARNLLLTGEDSS